MDEGGLVADALIQTCKELQAEGWDPVALYTIPTGHNPTGVTVQNDRKRDIYGACCLCVSACRLSPPRLRLPVPATALSPRAWGAERKPT